MAYNNILTALEDNILVISINRESKLNALTIETLKEIKEAVDEAQANDEVHGMILTGMGDKAFAKHVRANVLIGRPWRFVSKGSRFRMYWI